MDDYDECEWSLCSPCAVLLSFAALVRSGSFFEVWTLIMFIPRCIVPTRVSKCKMYPYLMERTFYLFHEDPGTVGG